MKRFVPFLFMLPVLCWSCQQEPDDMINNESNTTDSTLLRKFVMLDLSLPAGSDTDHIITFYYDDQKRIKRVEEIYNSTPVFTYATDYFYTGAAMTPYKTTVKAVEDGEVYEDTTFLFYTNGLVSRDSMIAYSEHELNHVTTSTYTVSGNSVIYHETERRYRNQIVYDVVDTDDNIIVNRENGNITEQISNYDPLAASNYNKNVYSDKPDPFFKTFVPYPMLWTYNDAQRNLRVEEMWGYDAANLNRHFRYTYTFRNDGYPLSVTSADVLNPIPDEWKGVYLYY